MPKSKLLKAVVKPFAKAREKTKSVASATKEKAKNVASAAGEKAKTPLAYATGGATLYTGMSGFDSGLTGVASNPPAATRGVQSKPIKHAMQHEKLASVYPSLEKSALVNVGPTGQAVVDDPRKAFQGEAARQKNSKLPAVVNADNAASRGPGRLTRIKHYLKNMSGKQKAMAAAGAAGAGALGLGAAKAMSGGEKQASANNPFA